MPAGLSGAEMNELRGGIMNAKYVDMIALADFVVRDCAIPEFDADGHAVAQQNEIAAAVFRWAALQEEGDE